MKTFLETDPGLSEHYSGATEDDIDSTLLEGYSDTTQIESDLTDLLDDWPKVSHICFTLF